MKEKIVSEADEGMDLVSVIVPVYKVEQYLENCVTSIRNQTYSRLEIILVDDGSPDSSGAICDHLAAEDRRIRVIHKQNEGAGLSRNTGIDAASGRWIMFVDSDDWIEPILVEELLAAQKRHQADYVLSGKKRVYPSGKEVSMPVCDREEVYEGKEAVLEEVFLPLAGDDSLTSGRRKRRGIGPYAILYSTQIINERGLHFLSEREYLSEDLLFNASYSKFSRKVVRLPMNYYYYRFNPTSFSNSFSPKRISLAEKLYLQSRQMLEEEHMTEMAGCRAERAFMMEFRHTMMQAAAVLKGKQIRQFYTENLNRELVQKIANVYPSEGIPKREQIMVALIRKKNWAVLYGYLNLQRYLVVIRDNMK